MMQVTLEDLSPSIAVISSSVELTGFQALPEAKPFAIRFNIAKWYFLLDGCGAVDLRFYVVPLNVRFR